MNNDDDNEVILRQAVASADLEPEPGWIDWGAYWPLAKELWIKGWPWSQIYAYFDTKLREKGRRMPGNVERFSKAMSARNRGARESHKKRIPNNNHPARDPGRDLSEAADWLGIPEEDLAGWLKENGWTYRDGHYQVAHEMAVNQGWLKNKPHREKETDGTWKTVLEVVVMASGLARLDELLLVDLDVEFDAELLEILAAEAERRHTTREQVARMMLMKGMMGSDSDCAAA